MSTIFMDLLGCSVVEVKWFVCSEFAFRCRRLCLWFSKSAFRSFEVCSKSEIISDFWGPVYGLEFCPLPFSPSKEWIIDFSLFADCNGRHIVGCFLSCAFLVLRSMLELVFENCIITITNCLFDPETWRQNCSPMFEAELYDSTNFCCKFINWFKKSKECSQWWSFYFAQIKLRNIVEDFLSAFRNFAVSLSKFLAFVITDNILILCIFTYDV